LNQAEVNWIPVTGQTEWEIEYRSSLNDNWTNWLSVTSQTRPYILTDLEKNRDYQLRIRALCDEDMISNPSNTVTFKTLNDDGISIPDLSSVHVYSYLNRVYIVNHTNLMINKVEIMDIYGRLVYQGLVNDNPATVNMNVPAGNYIVRITTPNSLMNYKVIINY
jgi:hypothetical protein